MTWAYISMLITVILPSRIPFLVTGLKHSVRKSVILNAKVKF